MSGVMNQIPSDISASVTISPSKIPSSSEETNGVSDSAVDVDENPAAPTALLNKDNELWVFGYGSLLWKVDFPTVKRQLGYIKGFKRRFFQHSIDHRGTVEQPGRVATLIPADPESKVFGAAYLIPDGEHEKVIKHLDHREKNGYTRVEIDFFPYPVAPGETTIARPLCIYVATQDNVSFAGPKSMADIAVQIHHAKGPSGANDEYVFRMADAFRTLFPDEQDDHLFQLESELKNLKRLYDEKQLVGTN